MGEKCNSLGRREHTEGVPGEVTLSLELKSEQGPLGKQGRGGAAREVGRGQTLRSRGPRRGAEADFKSQRKPRKDFQDGLHFRSSLWLALV